MLHDFRALYVGSKPEEMKNAFNKKRVKLVWIVMVVSAIFSSIIFVKNDRESALIEGKYLQRPTSGDGSIMVPLYYEMEGIKEDIMVQISEKRLSGEMKEEMFQKSYEFIDKNILGENESTDEIRSAINLMSEIPGTSINISWKFDSSIITYDGTLKNDSLEEEGRVTELTAVLNYYGEIREYELFLNIFPPQYDELTTLKKDMNSALEEADKKSLVNDYFELPMKVNDREIAYGSDQYTWMQILFLGGLTAFCIWYAMEQNLKKRMQLRKNQLMIDYPEIISKYTLLLNAGMTTKAAWERIGMDYTQRKKIVSDKMQVTRYAYEEMLITKNEIALGRSEPVAYEEFGRRCGILPYLKFSTIIVQNLKKGTRGMIPMLELEVTQARAERKEAVKRLGEEAGTKLLGPMVGMLVLVLLMIMIPAFLSFQF